MRDAAGIAADKVRSPGAPTSSTSMHTHIGYLMRTVNIVLLCHSPVSLGEGGDHRERRRGGGRDEGGCRRNALRLERGRQGQEAYASTLRVVLCCVLCLCVPPANVRAGARETSVRKATKKARELTSLAPADRTRLRAKFESIARRGTPILQFQIWHIARSLICEF